MFDRRQFLAALFSSATVAATSAIAAPRGGPSDVDPKQIEKTVGFGIPQPNSVSWSELVVDVPVWIRPVGIGGKVRSIGFTDFQLNGIPFEVDPYTASFDLPETDPVRLPEPLRLRVKFAQVAPGVIEEALMPSDRLRLTGVTTVDGVFKKWFFSVERSVDIPVDVSSENPIAQYHPLKYALAKFHELQSRGWSLPF